MTIANRAAVEVVIVARLGKWMTAAGLDATTVDGTNTDLTDPYDIALRYFEITDPTNLANSLEELEFLDIVELRTLQSIVRNFDDVTTRAGERSSNYSDLHKRMQDELRRKELSMAEQYGFGEAAVVIDSIYKDIQEDGE